ncbi:hypothetical protein GSI_03872 [Ganoderma sinense ZZ0214-1]|uniref:Smr domain-containing protein n=1 Tax=Ganoderma sinense ZZ0214-1 TaxID=1077348 RepID=A0A2G8SK60_9APHY|nr:hypothetical protein GSI_03872 [Ganoderma sinense ZZ0214-1]
MGLLEDLLGGLLKCLCAGQTPLEQQNEVPPPVPHKQEVTQQQPTPIYPPTQPARPPQPVQQPQPHRPTYAQQVSQPASRPPAPVEEQWQPAPDHHKKHKKHHGHGPSQDQGSVQGESQAHTATTPPPASPPHKASSPLPSRPWSPGRPDPNQVNQHNEYYMGLRARANAAGDDMARNFDAAHAAYESGDGARAKELSNAGKAAEKEMERLNEEAAEWIFRENNTSRRVGMSEILTAYGAEQDSGPGEVDLHGLYVKEAIRFTDKSIAEARARGDSQIRFIVGKGLHSANHVAKLKPAIEELMQKHGLVAELDEHNAGVLIVSLDGRATGKGRVMGAEDLTRGLEKKDECIIM